MDPTVGNAKPDQRSNRRHRRGALTDGGRTGAHSRFPGSQPGVESAPKPSNYPQGPGPAHGTGTAALKRRTAPTNDNGSSRATGRAKFWRSKRTSGSRTTGDRAVASNRGGAKNPIGPCVGRASHRGSKCGHGANATATDIGKHLRQRQHTGASVNGQRKGSTAKGEPLRFAPKPKPLQPGQRLRANANRQTSASATSGPDPSGWAPSGATNRCTAYRSGHEGEKAVQGAPVRVWQPAPTCRSTDLDELRDRVQDAENAQTKSSKRKKRFDTDSWKAARFILAAYHPVSNRATSVEEIPTDQTGEYIYSIQLANVGTTATAQCYPVQPKVQSPKPPGHLRTPGPLF